MQDLPGNGKFVDAVGEPVVLERHLVERDRQLQRRDAAEQGVEHDLHLGAGELLPDTLVPAVAEAELLAGIAAQVELVGLGVRGAHPSWRGRGR